MGVLVSCIGQDTVSSLLAVFSSENEISNSKQQFGKGFALSSNVYCIVVWFKKNYLLDFDLYVEDNYLHHNLQGFLQVDEIVHCLVQNKLLAQLPL